MKSANPAANRVLRPLRLLFCAVRQRFHSVEKARGIGDANATAKISAGRGFI